MKTSHIHLSYIITILIIISGIIIYYELHKISDIRLEYEVQKLHLEHRYKSILNYGLAKKDSTVFDNHEETLLKILQERKSIRNQLGLNDDETLR